MNAQGSCVVKRKNLFFEGTTKNIYGTTVRDLMEIEFSDRIIIPSENDKKTDIIPGKGIANNVITTAIFIKLEEQGVHTHYVAPGSNRASTIVKRTVPIPLVVNARFKAAGDFVQRYHVPNMMPFNGVLIDWNYKYDSACNPPIGESVILEKGILSKRELGYIEYVTERIAYIVKDFFYQCGGELIDFKIEFGKLKNGQIIVIDEISPDTCRVLDKIADRTFVKDVRYLAEAYIEKSSVISRFK